MTMPSTIIVEFGPEIDNSDDPNYMFSIDMKTKIVQPVESE